MHSPQEIKDYTPKHIFFVGIDSDGTVFDSMNIKHKDVFCPIALEIWEFGGKDAEFSGLWNEINLYSAKRGVNRFIGLLMAFDVMKDQTALPDYEPLRAFTGSGLPLSNAGLAEFTECSATGKEFLSEVADWSDRSDKLFEELAEGLPSFQYVRETIGILSGSADIMIVSSASGKGLEKDWSNAGLMDFVDIAAGQEAGGKKDQILYGTRGKYEQDKILMIGDAPGDLEAAKAAGGLFYPIVPGKEAESWKLLLDEAAEKFFDGSYKGGYEDSLICEFKSRLK